LNTLDSSQAAPTYLNFFKGKQGQSLQTKFSGVAKHSIQFYGVSGLGLALRMWTVS